ncbi:EpsG family protein [Staphylococcus saprophyticus]|uniref:EpsG family protein n=1 Tax=Staphylococcus saprophyticus TaxID=29385 RepID=UPI00380F0DFB
MIFLLISVILLFLLLYFGNYKLSSPVSLTLYCLLIVNLILKIFTYNFNESTDYMTYLSSFNKLSNLDFTGMISSDIFEWLFRTLSWFMIFIFPNSLFLVFVLIINLVLAVAIYRFHSNKILSFLSILIYTYLPLFFDMSTNILRQMLVLSLIVFILTINNRKRWVSIIFPAIHLSSIVIVIFIFIQNKIKLKYFVFLFIISIFLFAFNLNSKIFSALPIVSYYNSPQNFALYGGEGNRIDFFILTICVVLISILIYRKKYISILWLKYSLLSASYYFIFAFQAFSDRYAIYNWILLILLLPILLKIIKGRIIYK